MMNTVKSEGLSKSNALNIEGLGFVEFSGDQVFFDSLFKNLGFSLIGENLKKGLFLYRQGKIDFIVNVSPQSYAANFFKLHGPSISGISFRVAHQTKAYELALQRGAKTQPQNYEYFPFPHVLGIGGASLYLLQDSLVNEWYQNTFGVTLESPVIPGVGFKFIDHFTHNVPRDEMDFWCQFYEQVFDFKEARYFYIKGQQTGLRSKVMRSPCGTFSIPINEPTEEKSQIQEFLDQYKGSGVQHLALLTENIIDTMEKLKQQHIAFLSAPSTAYYRAIKDRLPHCNEDTKVLEKLGILVDGDFEGYLLQIFTKNLIGPIFFEVIQRKNHFGFGEGNFQALFDSIEEDQRERGYLK